MSIRQYEACEDRREIIENLHPKERAILHVIDSDECEDYGRGRASTGDVRRNTELDKNDRRYRFDTLNEAGVIEIERDNSLTPEGKPPEKVAVLTSPGRAIIDDDGFEEDMDRVDEPGVEERIQEIESRLDMHDESIEEIRDVINGRVFPSFRMLLRSVGKLEMVLETDKPLQDIELVDEKVRELNRRVKERLDK